MNCELRHLVTGHRVLRTTALAVLVAYQDYEFWLPKSQLRGDYLQELDMPQWLARKVGLLE